MLKSLNIENIAVIEKAEIDFSPGLNVMTGETGAGKSIVVDSINAVLGERTSRELVRSGTDSATVVAAFDQLNNDVKACLDDYGIDCDDELVLMRRVSSGGKSSCRINGVPCTVTMLHNLGDLLVNIHGQHDSQALLDPDRHYRFLDMYAGDDAALTEYSDAFHQLVSVRKRLKSLTLNAEEKDKQLELLTYQIDELTRADIKVGEREQLKQRKNVIINAMDIAEFINAGINALSGDEFSPGIGSAVDNLISTSESYKAIDDDMGNINTALYRLQNDVEEIKDMLTAKLGAIDFSQEELHLIDDRLDMYYRLSTKYGDTEEDMISYLNDAIAQRNAINNSDEELERLNAEYDDIYDRTISAAAELSKQRKDAAMLLEQDVKEQLEYLDMPGVRFSVNFQEGKLSTTGYDRIEFYISTNPGEPPKPIARIASGGELSRIMLAIKNIIARHDSIGTLIFDEIDTGVSGRASRKIGLKLKSVSDMTQVICVTHSAQIASVADNHLLIEKSFVGDRTYTKVSSLSFEQRKHELARIMGGIEVTDALLDSAEELIMDQGEK